MPGVVYNKQKIWHAPAVHPSRPKQNSNLETLTYATVNGWEEERKEIENFHTWLGSYSSSELCCFLEPIGPLLACHCLAETSFADSLLLGWAKHIGWGGSQANKVAYLCLPPKRTKSSNWHFWATIVFFLIEKNTMISNNGHENACVYTHS